MLLAWRRWGVAGSAPAAQRHQGLRHGRAARAAPAALASVRAAWQGRGEAESTWGRVWPEQSPVLCQPNPVTLEFTDSH